MNLLDNNIVEGLMREFSFDIYIAKEKLLKELKDEENAEQLVQIASENVYIKMRNVALLTGVTTYKDTKEAILSLVNIKQELQDQYTKFKALAEECGVDSIAKMK